MTLSSVILLFIFANESFSFPWILHCIEQTRIIKIPFKMLSKKQKILVQPFIERNYKKHRDKVHSAQPAIDFASPAQQPHVLIKLKKIQKERERMKEIERENQRLLQKLSYIMTINRLENYWQQPHPTFLGRVYIKTPQQRSRAHSVPPKQNSAIDCSTDDMIPLKKINNSRSCARCPTCCGRPQSTVVKIPEERVPFEPQRKSYNQKLSKQSQNIHKCCRFCC